VYVCVCVCVCVQMRASDRELCKIQETLKSYYLWRV